MVYVVVAVEMQARMPLQATTQGSFFEISVCLFRLISRYVWQPPLLLAAYGSIG